LPVSTSSECSVSLTVIVVAIEVLSRVFGSAWVEGRSGRGRRDVAYSSTACQPASIAL
jgi:hypothetical protein